MTRLYWETAVWIFPSEHTEGEPAQLGGPLYKKAMTEQLVERWGGKLFLFCFCYFVCYISHFLFKLI